MAQAEVCKTLNAGSIPAAASISFESRVLRHLAVAIARSGPSVNRSTRIGSIVPMGWVGPGGGFDSAQVTVEIGPHVAHESGDALIALRDGLDDVIGQQDAHVYGLYPHLIVVFAAEHDVTISDSAAVRKLQTVAAVDPDRIGTDEFQLSVDAQPALLEQLPLGGILGKLVRVGSTRLGVEGAPLPAHRPRGRGPHHPMRR